MTMLFGQEHVDAYRASGGAQGYDWRGTTILLLTTTGRKSGQERTSALIYRDYEDAYLIVASKGGADAPPAWFVNLSADPHVQVQIKGERFAATARVATAEEKPAMWQHMTEVWPDYDEYQTKTEREIPIVVLERS
ncbi:MAG: nitroreductase family deazaflavin-dependent oxidoreductase [Jatrophihabitantaceae bacterium]